MGEAVKGCTLDFYLQSIMCTEDLCRLLIFILHGPVLAGESCSAGCRGPLDWLIGLSLPLCVCLLVHYVM